MFHDMTPVAGGIAYADQQRLIFLACKFKCIWPILLPVHRITGMLQQVWAGGMHQCIGVVRT